MNYVMHTCCSENLQSMLSDVLASDPGEDASSWANNGSFNIYDTSFC